MKKLYKTFFFLSLFFGSFLKSQEPINSFIPGTICKNRDCSEVDSETLKTNLIANGNGTIATSYTVSACGLNFVTVSIRLNKRNFGCCGTGANQPAPITVSGLPACFTSTNLAKAFLYSGASGNGIAATATITNSSNVTQSFPMTIIGSHVDKCWGYAGTYNYRADVSSIINGNGSYTISGLPTNPPTVGNDTDGATLFIIYTDPSQTYTGHFIIADGCREGSGAWSGAISGFNVCGATNSQTNFALISDLQKIANVPFKMNSATDNFTLTTATQDVWNYLASPAAAATAGQTSATFGITTGGDCWNLVAAGMYYRTACLACTSSPCVVLPIELTKFEVACENNKGLIKWETSTEKNNDYFSILRSEDGNNFNTIAVVPGNGNSQTNKRYSYADNTIEPGKIYYYKLKQTDYNKTDNFVGNTIYLSCEKKNSQLDVFPNPSSHEVYIVSGEDLTDVNIVISDGFGQKIKIINNVNLVKNERFIIDIRDVINGCYHLVISNNETLIQKKMVTYK